jgi:anti-sigma B factor antagonist
MAVKESVDEESVRGELVDGKTMLTRREHDKVIILEVWGDVDIHSAQPLGRELEKLLCREKHILLNLFQTYYIDTIGLSLLIDFKKRQREKGKFFGLCSPRSYMKRILNLVKLDGFFSIFENEGNALAAFSESLAVK